MKYLRAIIIAASAVFFMAGSALAQNGTVTNHAFAIGKGAGVTGYTSLLCASAQLAVGQSAADPICKTITGDVTLSAAGATTLATVNSNVGSFGSATQSPIFTVNGKGLITAASLSTITPAIGSITGLGTGCATFLATPSSANLRACITDEAGSGAAYFVGGALGTPASATLTNATGLPLSGHTTQAANTIVANATGSAAVPTAVDISTLTAKGTPAGTDLVLLSDQAASGALKKVTVSSLATSAGVSSIAGNTGAFTLSGLLTNSSNVLQVVAASKSDQQTGTSTTLAVTPSHQQDHDSAVKAWCYFPATTTGTNACTASFGVTSITRSAAGVYTALFSTAFLSTAYGCTGSAEGTNAAHWFIEFSPIASKTTTVIAFVALNSFASTSDPTNIMISCEGRQ